MLLAAFLLTLFAFGLVSQKTEGTIITAPVVVTASGLGLGLLFQSEGRSVQPADVLFLGELALAAILFIDASRIRWRSLIGDRWLPLRLLVIANPLIIVLGALAALLLLPGLSLLEACIVATLLAPNAGLAAVSANPTVPPRIRQALSVESGLSDGVTVPLLMLFIALARPRLAGDFSWLPYFLMQVVAGALTGAAIGGAGGALVGWARRRGWMDARVTQISLLALALLSWRVAEEVVGANGFIAAFFGGITVRVGHQNASEHLLEFTDSWGLLLNLAVLFAFGGLVAGSLAQVSPRTILFVVLSLTIVRMIPVAISLAGSTLHRASVLFLGWFGPRGLSSIVLGLVFLETEARLESERLILHAVGITVLVSIFAHELSARPLASRYARFVEQLDEGAVERKAVSQPVPQDAGRIVRAS